MQISFIYPEMNMESYLDTLDGFNSDINLKNIKSLLPRIIASLLSIFTFISWAIVVWIMFYFVTWLITGKSVNTIYLGIALYLIAILFSFDVVRYMLKKSRPLILEIFRTQDKEESYTFSAYVERKEGSKLVKNDVEYYRMCDILRSSRINDATAVCNGDLCKVEVAYSSPKDSGVFTFNLPYHDGSSLDKVIVDFNRRCVIFPKEASNNEELS